MNTLKLFLTLKLNLPQLEHFLTKTTLEIAKIPPKEWHRPKSPADLCFRPPEEKPCYDARNVVVERGNIRHSSMIRSFLYAQYWPREPSTTSLYMSLHSDYLRILTEKYSCSGDRFLAFEEEARTGEYKLVGVCVVNKTMPWEESELEEWAHYLYSRPERTRCYLRALCLRGPGLFKSYNIPYIYDVQVLATAAEVTGRGVGTLLLRAALENARELRHPLTQVVATSAYVAKICERLRMKRAWSLEYKDFVDDAGQSVFFPRRPHTSVSVYIRPFTCALGSKSPSKPP